MRKRFPTRPIPRRRGAATGFFVLILGLWGALIPFVGPYFNYQIGTTNTWDWSHNRLWLSVLPGAAAAVGGLIMMCSKRRSSASLGGLIALAGGLWFVIGPSMSMLWNHGVQATGPAFGDNGTRVLEWLGFYYAVGALITMFSAYGLGFLAALSVTGEAVPAAEPAPAAPAAAEPAAEPVTADGNGRRRGLLRRRPRRGEPQPVEQPAERR